MILWVHNNAGVLFLSTEAAPVPTPPTPVPTTAARRRPAMPLEDGAYWILAPEPSRMQVRSQTLAPSVIHTADDEAAAIIALIV